MRRLHKALAAHPQKDSDHFIPTIEQAWLGVLSGKADTDKLVRRSQMIEDKKIVRFENEMRRFFLKELDEYYVPGEHEMILFHILTGLAFASKGMKDKVRIEAQRAANYLPGPLATKNDFDHGAIRILLAALWLYCDEWEHAAWLIF